MDLTIAITEQYQRLVADSTTDMSFAVRSSATAEDLPDASFAGQQETFLNIVGLENIMHAIKEVFASLYNDRAISYRVHKGFLHADVALSAGIQRMVRSDKGAAGVMFTLDTESGFRDAVFVTSSYGLGETVVQGAVNPDEFYVHKPMLEAGKKAVVRRNLGSKMIKMTFSAEKVAGKSVITEDVEESLRHQFSINDEEVMELARYARSSKALRRPMDIEWGKDGVDGKLYILQARPETVQSQAGAGKQEKFKLKSFSKVLASGRAIGQKIGVGPVRVVKDPKEMDQVKPGDVLVADMTDPNWEPVMKRASAIVTNRGGRTCHAAIIARELGIPAIVGCGDATETLTEGEVVTVSCTEGDTGHVYRGKLDFEVTTRDISAMPDVPVKVMMNVGNPELAFEFAQLPNAGVGLARVEFIINNVIGIHPKAILDVERLPASKRDEIKRRARGYASPKEFFVEKLVEGVPPSPPLSGRTRSSSACPTSSPTSTASCSAANSTSRKKKTRCSASAAPRATSPNLPRLLRDGMPRHEAVREEMGLTNVQLMVPFVRTVGEGKAVVDLLAEHGLKRARTT
jgi:pyruvate,water dikinase